VPTVIFTGLACGTLLAAVGLVLWKGFQQTPGLSHAVQAVGWLAGGLLLIGAVLAWWGDHSLSAPPLRLILMAAIAAPPQIRHRRNAPPPSPSPWGTVTLILPALVLTGIGLFWISGSTGADGTEMSSTPVTLVGLATAFCGGLGARALGEALSEIAASTPQVKWPSAAAYTLLTLLAGGTALVNMWQRGSVWGEAASEGGMAVAWLAWSAAWLGPRRPPRLRAALIAVAALLLIVLAAGY
jgi:hypothetical protein